MRDAGHGEGKTTTTGGQGQGWQHFGPKALASLTDQQIRDMAKAWLDQTLAEDWERRLLRQHEPKDRAELRGALASLYVDDMEDLEAGRYKRIESDVARVLEEGSVAQQSRACRNFCV